MGKVVHMRKFLRGRMTPEEYHAKWAFPPGVRCTSCQGAKVVLRAITLAPLADARRVSPWVDALDPVALLQMVVQIKGADGQPVPYVRIGTAYSCAQCRSALERTLAKLPSWVQVEFNRGPGPDKPAIQVPA